MLNAFWRVAPSLRLKVLAMRAACVFLRARVFKVLTCSGVHGRRLVAFLAINNSRFSMKDGLISRNIHEEQQKSAPYT